jgi:phage baseplate assembly protein gpV
MIQKALIKSYDADNHQLTVQPIGNLTTHWPHVPVARSIPAADCTVGSQCVVLAFSATDPTDAVVIAVFTGASGAPYTPPPSTPTSYDGGTAASMEPFDDSLDGGDASSTYGPTEYVDAGAA